MFPFKFHEHLFIEVFPSEPVVLSKHRFCFVFVLDIGKNVFPTQMNNARDFLMMPRTTQPLPDA